MARVEIGETVTKSQGNRLVPAVGALVEVNARDNGQTTVYAGATGGTTLANPLTTDVAGRIEGWVEEGSYDLVVSGTGITTYTQRFEAVSGSDAAGAVLIATDQTVEGAKTFTAQTLILRETADGGDALRVGLDGSAVFALEKGGGLRWGEGGGVAFDAYQARTTDEEITFSFAPIPATADFLPAVRVGHVPSGNQMGGYLEVVGKAAEQRLRIDQYNNGWRIFCEPQGTPPPGESQKFLETYTPWGLSVASSTNDKDMMLLVRDQSDFADVSLVFEFTGVDPAYGRLQVGNVGDPYNGKDIGLKLVTNDVTAGVGAHVVALQLAPDGSATFATKVTLNDGEDNLLLCQDGAGGNLFRVHAGSQLVDSHVKHRMFADAEFQTNGIGPVVKSPNGTKYRIVAANGGALSTVAA